MDSQPKVIKDNIWLGLMHQGRSLLYRPQVVECELLVVPASELPYEGHDPVECEPFDTYPRTYDLLHASGLFSIEQKRCNISSIMLEMDRMLRPGGCAYIHVFSGFSLHVPSGMTVALVGESGSGKSTVISLLERFLTPKREVLIDGINLKKLQLGWIRDKIGLVSQEPILFTTTIKENIAYGKAGATLEEIRTVTEIANVTRFKDKML